jgi:hypothetical protein
MKAFADALGGMIVGGRGGSSSLATIGTAGPV